MLDKNIKDRIKSAAYQQYLSEQKCGLDPESAYQDSFTGFYVAGAEKEAERVQGLTEALEKIEACAKQALPSRISADDPIAIALYNCRHFATEALTKYNNSK